MRTSFSDSAAFGSRVIPYRVRYSSRKTLGVSVTPGMTVEVTAPAGTSPDRIRDLVRKKARWIQKQQRFFLAFYPRPSPRKYRSGETHYYLGRQLILRVRTGDSAEVRYKGRELEVTVSESGQAGRLVEKWFRDRAKEKFPEFLDSIAERFFRFSVQPAGLGIRRMPGRWGSCSGTGRITLHPDLIKSPRGCIEYVMTHELCHLVCRNHDRKFWDLQLKMMPDWMKWKAKLEKFLA